MDKPLDPLCPAIQAALDVLSRPWTGLVLAALTDGSMRYSELCARVPGIGDKTLSARLKELESRGLVDRVVETERPVRVAYRLTPKGAGFRKVVQAIDAWGRQFADSPAPRSAKKPAPPKPSHPDAPALKTATKPATRGPAQRRPDVPVTEVR